MINEEPRTHELKHGVTRRESPLAHGGEWGRCGALPFWGLESPWGPGLAAGGPAEVHPPGWGFGTAVLSLPASAEGHPPGVVQLKTPSCRGPPPCRSVPALCCIPRGLWGSALALRPLSTFQFLPFIGLMLIVALKLTFG